MKDRPVELSPYAVEFTTTGYCINNCVYCPQDVFQHAYSKTKGSMKLSLKDFKSMLRHIPSGVTLIFSGFSEPFLNECCVDMIEYADEKNYTMALFTTLVGLPAKDVYRLKRCKNLKSIVLHLPDCCGNAKIPLTDMYRETLVTALTTLKINGFMSMNGSYEINNRAGLLNFESRYVKGWFYCPMLVTPRFLTLPNCDVVLCCQDFGLKHHLGNLLDQSFVDIMHSKAFHEISSNRFHYDGDVLCRRCSQAQKLPNYLMQQSGRKILKLYRKIKVATY